MCFERVFGVMSSGDGYIGVEDAMVEERGLTIGDADSGLSKSSGWRVVEEETEELSRGSEVSDDNDVVLEDGE
jgi:hypothetical protein